MKTDKSIGKLMSLALRHNPKVLNLELDANGWASVSDLIDGLNKKNIPMDLNRLTELVESNDKKRYRFNDDKSKICANQGHSIKIDLDLQATEPPFTLYHGTVQKFMQSIRNEGLQKQSRHHVHLSATEETAITVGSRRGKPVILKVNAKKMHAVGYPFFLSDNGVWLTDHVPPEFIES